MRQWDGLVEEYLRGCEAKGLAQVTVLMRRRELERWGSWLKRRRPRVELGQVEPEHIIRYIQGRTAFRVLPVSTRSADFPGVQAG